MSVYADYNRLNEKEKGYLIDWFGLTIGNTEVESMYGKGYLLAFIVDEHTGLVVDIVIVPSI